MNAPHGPPVRPHVLRMHPADTVVIVGTEGGLAAGTVLPDGGPGAGLVLRDKVPQIGRAHV